MDGTKIRIAKEWFSEGGMRQSYRAAQLNPGGNGVTALCVKLFKDEKMKPAVVFHEALTQAIAQKYAVGFNNLCERRGLMLRISFLPVWVLHLTERSKTTNGQVYDVYATMEPFLPGNYVKLSDNSGRHLDDIPAQAAQSFSHYSFLASGRRLVCVDIQGVSELAHEDGLDDAGDITAKTLSLTDPQIHSLDGNLFGAGNLGIGGINAFISSYKRTKFDEQLGLAHLGPAMLVTSKAAAHAVPTLPPVSEAPPFDTAELASRLSEDEREACGEVNDNDMPIPAPVAPVSMPVVARTAAQEDAMKGKFEELHLNRQSAKDRHSSRLTQFTLGGDIHRLSMCARTYTMSWSADDANIRDVV